MTDPLPDSPADPRPLDRLRPVVAALAVAAFLITLATTLLGIAARNLGLGGLEWTFEAAAIAFLWTSFLGVLVAELRRENVALTLLSDRLRGRAARLVALAGALATVLFAAMMLRSGIDFALRSGLAPTPVMRLPRIVQIAPLLLFAAGVLAIVGLRALALLRAGGRP